MVTDFGLGKIKIEYLLGEIVYLVTDGDQYPHIVTGITVSSTGGVLYSVTHMDVIVRVSSAELQRDANMLYKLMN